MIEADSCCSVAIGYDEGTVVVKVGREEPVVSMDTGGKVIWARHNEIQTVNVRAIGDVDLTVCLLSPQSPIALLITTCQKQ